MICAACGSLIGDSYISCPTCAVRKNEQGFFLYQLQVLGRAVAGGLMLHLRAIKGVRHVKLFGADLTWCGLPVEPGHRRSSAYYNDLESERLCKSCLAAVRQAVEEAAAK